MNINDAKDTVISAGKELVNKGLIARTWGNVSQRMDTNKMVITPSGRDYLSLSRDDIVEVDIESLEWSGDVKPSSEKGAHANCYKIKDANFVIHTHQLYASIVSACEVDFFRPDVEKYELLCGKVMVSSYGLPSTKKLSEGIKEALKASLGNAIIMRNHGALCYGRDFDEAFEAASQLEEACKEYIEQKYMKEAGTDSLIESEYADFILSKFSAAEKEYEPKEFTLSLDVPYYEINNSLPCVALSYVKTAIRPMVDDYAQIVGVKMKSVDYDKAKVEKALKSADAVFVKGYGAVCAGPTADDAKAVSMIVEKNTKAFMGASLFGKPKPINALESKLMRTIYKMKYSKQISK